MSGDVLGLLTFKAQGCGMPNARPVQHPLKYGGREIEREREREQRHSSRSEVTAPHTLIGLAHAPEIWRLRERATYDTTVLVRQQRLIVSVGWHVQAHHMICMNKYDFHIHRQHRNKYKYPYKKYPDVIM